MTTARLLGTMVAARLVAPETDGDLLGRFVANRDEAAFRQLVIRHGPLVLGVCRRIVPDTHLADDAFQAVFAVLATKANSLDGSRPLGPWLFSVASKVSVRARAMIGRRRQRETLMAAVPETPSPIPEANDWAAIIDAEIAELSEVCRSAVILCELQGLSRKDAAAKLGIAEGTLSSRLAAGRKALAERLRKRGVTGTAVIATVIVPPALTTAAVQAASGPASAVVRELAHGVIRTMLVAKWKLIPIMLAGVVFALGGWDATRGEPATAGSEASTDPKIVDPSVAEEDPGMIWLLSPNTGELLGYTPQGVQAQSIRLSAGPIHPATFLGITGDGQLAMYAGIAGVLPQGRQNGREQLQAGTLTVSLIPLHHRSWVVTNTGIPCHPDSQYVSSLDGQTLLVSRPTVPTGGADLPTQNYETIAYSLSKYQGTKQPALATGLQLVAEIANGDRLLVKNDAVGTSRPSYFISKVGEIEPSHIARNLDLAECTVSGDGQTILGTRQDIRANSNVADVTLHTIDRKSEKSHRIESHENTQWIYGKWAPNGKQIVYQWHSGSPGATGRLIVCNADGSQPRTLRELEPINAGNPIRLQDKTHLIGWFPVRSRTMKNASGATSLQNDLIWFHDRTANQLHGYTATGQVIEKITLPADQTFLGTTPDGRKILYATTAQKASLPTYHIRDFGKDTLGTDLGIPVASDQFIHWAPDGRRFLLGTHEDRKRIVGVRAPIKTYQMVDVNARTADRVILPPEHEVDAFTPDGRQLILRTVAIGPESGFGKLAVFGAGNKPAPLDPTGDTATPITYTPSADGQHLVVGAWKLDDNRPWHGLFRLNVGTGRMSELFHEPGQNMSCGAESPDGKHLAIAWSYTKDPSAGWDELRLSMTDADGTGRKTFTLRDRAKGESPESLVFLGWFARPKSPALMPKVLPPKPVPLARVPDPTRELRKALVGFDDYRHGSEERFAELEKKADRLVQEYPLRDDRARIWHRVAFVAGQSDIFLQLDRVQRYCGKCLEISRDPRDRGDCYSMLASIATLKNSGLEYAKGRRAAAEVLLTGYQELLTLDLPDQVPELPVVEKISGDILEGNPMAAWIRAKQASQLAARDDARYLVEVVARRDTMVTQLRGLFEPHPNVHGHGPEGPEELHALAKIKLTPADAETLMRRVFPKK